MSEERQLAEKTGTRMEVGSAIEAGQWYWLDEENEEDEELSGNRLAKNASFACVVNVGSNFVELESPTGRSAFSTTQSRFPPVRSRSSGRKARNGNC